MPNFYFDDFKVGDHNSNQGGITVTEGQIIDFAMRWDPQVFHLDAETEKNMPYGGLMPTFSNFIGGPKLVISLP